MPSSKDQSDYWIDSSQLSGRGRGKCMLKNIKRYKYKIITINKVLFSIFEAIKGQIHECLCSIFDAGMLSYNLT
jgi:hypothetical protein